MPKNSMNKVLKHNIKMKDQKSPKGPMIKNESEASKAPVEAPSKDTVKNWVRRDLESARYMLEVILKRHPEIVDELGDIIYETVMRKESGPAIDHVKNNNAG